MGTDMEKTANRARMWGLTCLGMTMGIWDMVEEASVSLSPAIGAQLLRMAEKQLGLEIAGESPEHILTELARIFVDEFGYCSSADVKREGNVVSVTLVNAVGFVEFGMLIKEHGITKMFSHPFLCTGIAALNRLGVRSRSNVAFDDENKGFVVSYELI